MDLFLKITNTPKTLHVIESLQSSTATADAQRKQELLLLMTIVIALCVRVCFRCVCFGGGGWHQGWLCYALVMGF